MYSNYVAEIVNMYPGRATRIRRHVSWCKRGTKSGYYIGQGHQQLTSDGAINPQGHELATVANLWT